jgi:hypothetical protein
LLPDKQDAFYALIVSVCRETDEINAIAICAGIVGCPQLQRMPSLCLLRRSNFLQYSSACVHDLYGNAGRLAYVIPDGGAENPYPGVKRGRGQRGGRYSLRGNNDVLSRVNRIRYGSCPQSTCCGGYYFLAGKKRGFVTIVTSPDLRECYFLNRK